MRKGDLRDKVYLDATTCFSTARKASRTLRRRFARGPGHFNRLMRPRLGGALSNRLPGPAGLTGGPHYSSRRFTGLFNSRLHV
jgi:hypothetical protein